MTQELIVYIILALVSIYLGSVLWKMIMPGRAEFALAEDCAPTKSAPCQACGLHGACNSANKSTQASLPGLS